jgi:hypothetical protein
LKKPGTKESKKLALKKDTLLIYMYEKRLVNEKRKYKYSINWSMAKGWMAQAMKVQYVLLFS